MLSVYLDQDPAKSAVIPRRVRQMIPRWQLQWMEDRCAPFSRTQCEEPPHGRLSKTHAQAPVPITPHGLHIPYLHRPIHTGSTQSPIPAILTVAPTCQ